MGRTLLVSALLLLAGCAAPRQDRNAGAKTLFEQTVKQYHLPSADAHGPARQRLLDQAAGGYERVLKTYRDQPYWCAQALRSLGNVRAEQGNFDDAVKLYRRVGERYPQQDWEVLQAWKSAADLLWDAGRQDEAHVFYWQIVQRFDNPDASAVVQTVVRAARRRV
jgi:TolA-binding protein